jgi:hypothetical protein
LEAALQQFADPQVLAAGKVNVIALDAVVERFGARWPLRRDQVHEHVQATLDRQLGSQGYHLRISDTDLLVCQPNLERLTGQAFCLRVLREILQHFLGQSEGADIGVHEVLSISADGIEAKRVDAASAYAAEAAGAAASSASADATSIGTVDIWTPFVASNGRRVNVSCSLAPVFELKRGNLIGVRFARRVTDASTGLEFAAPELERLSRSDRLRIDLGLIVQGLNLVRQQGPGCRTPALIIPISFSSPSNLEGRARIVTAFKEARSHSERGVISELCEIDGVPATTLLSAAAMVRPFSLFVIGHVAEFPPAWERPLREAGLRGVSMACPPHLAGAEFHGWANSAIRAAKRASRAVLLYQLPSEDERRLAASLGATHASVDVA